MRRRPDLGHSSVGFPPSNNISTDVCGHIELGIYALKLRIDASQLVIPNNHCLSLIYICCERFESQ